MENRWSINPEVCKRCGNCIEVCPNRIIQKNEKGAVFFREDRLWSCFSCGHCMAVCVPGAVQVPGMSYERDFYPQPHLNGQEHEQFKHLIDSRRAVRSFQDKPVAHEALQAVVDAIQSAPPGFPPVKTELVVVEDTAIIRKALPLMIDFYDHLVRMIQNPISRQFVRRSAGREKFVTLEKHVVPLLIDRLPDLKSGREDTITRRAPALILFHADRNTENYRTDIYIALTYGFLSAQALGLGASAMDLIPPAVEKSKALRQLFRIPESNEVVASMILGYPKHRFQRGIQRELKSVTWIEPEKIC